MVVRIASSVEMQATGLYGDAVDLTVFAGPFFAGTSSSGTAASDLILGDHGAFDYTIDGALATLDLLSTTDPLLGGPDTVNGDDANDILFGGTAGDTLNGGNNNDLIFGDHGEVRAKSDGRVDPALLPLARPNDLFTFTTLFRGAADGAGNDMAHGNAGEDILLGAQGDDSLFGDAGDDDLFGGHNVAGGIDANDTLDGGCR